MYVSKCIYADDNSAIALATQAAAIIQEKQNSQIFNNTFQNSDLFPQLKKPISLDVQNVPVRNLLQIMADITKQNMIISGSVNGNMTLRLHNIPWGQALSIILQTQGLAKQQIGNVLLIAPVIELACSCCSRIPSTTTIDRFGSFTIYFNTHSIW